MAESNTAQAIVSNPETQLNGTNNSDINMSNNETLPATTLEAEPQPGQPDTPTQMSRPPFSLPNTPAQALFTDSEIAADPPANNSLTSADASALPGTALTNGAAESNHDTTIDPSTLLSAPAPLDPLPTTAPIPPPTTSPATKPPSTHSPAPTRGSTPAPSASLSKSADHPIPSALMESANSAAGSPTRAYINTKVTPSLLEGMKWVARNEPERPLRWLGEFLLARSREVEGT